MFWLLALWSIPVTAFLVARRYAAAKLWRVVGVAFGAVVTPASLGLTCVSVGPMSPFFEMIGFVLVLLHETPGYKLSILFGLVPPGCIVEGLRQHASIEALNGVVWATAYGGLGWVVDVIRARRKRPPKA
jgi:hypothetical protein